jgi:hypothetical protein
MIGGTYRTVIFTPRGAFLPNWTLSGPSSDDGALWSPTDPSWICAGRNGQGRFWHVETLATKGMGCVPAHTAWHPNGAWYFAPAYLEEIETGANVLPGTGVEPVHPDINPAEAAAGTAARIVVDDRDWFSGGTGRPRLYAPTIAELMSAALTGNWRVTSRLLAVHYSSMENNTAHAHPHWSFDGRYILWTSDTSDLRDGTPPGGTGGGTDLFVIPMTGTAPPVTPPPAPALNVSPTALAFAAVQGGAAPAAKTLNISNSGGGSLSWTVSDNASWLAVSAAAGTGNAGVQATASPAGLAAGTYVGTITVTASGAAGSPKTVGVTLTVSPPAATPGGDLTVEGLTPSPSSVQSGGLTTVTYSVVNRGTSSVTASLVEKVYLSRTAGVDSSAVLLATTAARRVTLAPAARYSTAVKATIPGGTASGSYYLVVAADANSALAETNERNNARSAALAVTRAAQTFTLDRTSLEFWTAADGSWRAGTEPVRVTTSSPSTSWTATESASWLRMSPTSGNGSTTLFVSTSAAGLQVGTYQTTVRVTAGGVSKTIGVTLHIE